jgi:hypothetical protein
MRGLRTMSHFDEQKEMAVSSESGEARHKLGRLKTSQRIGRRAVVEERDSNNAPNPGHPRFAWYFYSGKFPCFHGQSNRMQAKGAGIKLGPVGT